jgi:aryl-alcohol dehydrogenase-like predicted oxidoreductase
VIVWSPLAEGILTGKYRRGAPLPADSRYATVDKPGMYGERLTAPVFDAVEALGRFAAEKGVTLSAFCLAWLINRPGITSVLAGPSTLAQLDDHLASRDVVLSSAELVQIEGVVGPQSTISPYCIHL